MARKASADSRRRARRKRRPPEPQLDEVIESSEAAGEAAHYAHPFERVVVGRRRQHRIDVRFALGSVTEADARALALGIFRDVTPSGAAAAVDRRLDGAITEIARRRMFSGSVGEIFVLPTGRHPIGADYVAFVGLGAFDRFDDEVLQVAAENLLRTFVNTRVEEFATVLFGGGSGERPASALRNLLLGFVRGLVDADRDHHFRRIVFCERDPERYAELKEEGYRLASTELAQDVELTFDEVVLREPLEPVAMLRAAAPRKDPVYLIVRQEAAGSDAEIRSAVLTAGSKATVVTGGLRLKRRELESVRRRLVDPETPYRVEDGRALSELVLAAPVREVLPAFAEHHLVVVHDAPMSRVPWEMLAFPARGGRGSAWLPAAEKGISHRYAADNLSVAKWLEARIQDEVLNVLLVVNPTEDLPAAEREGGRVRELFNGIPGCDVDELRGAAATSPALLKAFSSGRYDVVHYAGHAFFDEEHPERSGILAHGDVTVTGAELAGRPNLPTLVFFNACEAARVRRRRAGGGRSSTADRLKRIPEAVGFAEAFMRGGVGNFLGTYWPVGDEAAEVFADVFYKGVVRGTALGEAVQNGRRAVRETGSKDWADYVFYGNAEFLLKEATARVRAAAAFNRRSS